MTRTVFIDCGAAETRAACLVDGEPSHFWFGPARGDEGLPREPQAGDIFAARVKSVSRSLNGAFVDIGAGRDGFLPLARMENPPAEGALLIVMARRPPVGGKGAVLTADWAKGLAGEARATLEKQARETGVGALGEIRDAALQASIHGAPDRASGMPDLIVNDAIARNILEEYWRTPVRFADRPLDAAIEDALADALAQETTLPGGARLFFHETRAGALIDVDSASSAHGSTGRLEDRTNRIAAERVLIELQRRDIGGRIVIDFLPPSGAAARTQLAEFMKERLKAFPKARFGRIAPDGLCDMTLPRRRLSLLERASESAGGPGRLVEGRRMTRDWAAKAAIRSLERALRANPSARPRLLVGADIGGYLHGERPQWADRLKQRYGARFVIEPSLKEMRSHETS